MPRDKSIKSILLIGSGPIVIGQACEFDYSGSQAARSLKEEGIEVSLINSNPATIMTDKVVAENVYLLPLTPKSIVKILEERKIDAVFILHTLRYKPESFELDDTTTLPSVDFLDWSPPLCSADILFDYDKIPEK